MPFRFTRVQLIAVAAIALVCQPVFAAGSEPEDDLRSAIVLSFLRYSEWRHDEPGDYLIGVVGRSSLISSLRRTVEGKALNGHAVRVVDLKSTAEARGFRVVYIATDNGAEIKQALAMARPAGVLTIGEDDRFLNLGGAVNLLVVNGRMTFEVNLTALETSGVTVSSKLLRFGHIWEHGKSRPAG